MDTLLTSCTFGWEELHSLTAPNKKEYCDRWGLNFVDHRLQSVGDSWYRPLLWLDELSKLKQREILWFLGADTIITNHTIYYQNIIRETDDFVIGLDVNGTNSDSVFFRNVEGTRRLLELTIKNEHRDTCEQDSMQRLLGSMICKVKILPQRYLNSYLYLNYPQHPDHDGGEFKIGDFVLHLPGMPVDKKIRIMKEYLPQVIK